MNHARRTLSQTTGFRNKHRELGHSHVLLNIPTNWKTDPMPPARPVESILIKKRKIFDILGEKLKCGGKQFLLSNALKIDNQQTRVEVFISVRKPPFAAELVRVD